MEAEIKENRKKLTAGLILFIIAVILLLAIVLYFATPLKEWVEASTVFSILAGVAPVTCFLLFDISLILNLSYRKEVLHAGALSTVLLVLCCIVVIPFFIIMVIILFFTGNIAALWNRSGQGKTIKIIGDDGKEYTLTQKDSFGNEFTDQNDDLWITQDNGKTFKRVSVKIKDENGNDFTLTPRFWGSDTYYQDQNGDYWTTYTSGNSYEREERH